uniref:Uncharacterized protein n=1 Tax=Knipowitschia caucasica TaxID=637954 RepID=A0AAV2KCQ6_KNICA
MWRLCGDYVETIAPRTKPSRTKPSRTKASRTKPSRTKPSGPNPPDQSLRTADITQVHRCGAGGGPVGGREIVNHSRTSCPGAQPSTQTGNGAEHFLSSRPMGGGRLR